MRSLIIKSSSCACLLSLVYVEIVSFYAITFVADLSHLLELFLIITKANSKLRFNDYVGVSKMADVSRDKSL